MQWEYTLDQLDEIAGSVLEHLSHPIVCFEGSLGAGKTTLIKKICQKLGCEDTANSPTFSLINPYQTSQAKWIYHFDCYRLNTIEEALDFGVDEYLDSGNWCFIEWPELILPLLDQHHYIKIEALQDGKRKLTLK
jgi:tRNA threonylcarbamoyladenosine biosynthesis protein TsaE